MFELSGNNCDSFAQVRTKLGIKIPMRDGVVLNANLYTLGLPETASPAIVTLTPYGAQFWHQFALYFAAHGYAFLSIDVRGRGNSDGVFMPFVNEVSDGHDAVEWAAQQAFCNGQVAMWGGSYAAHAQWATIREGPPHLVTIVPTAAPYIGIDMPMRNNISFPYVMQWLTLVSGRTTQERFFFNSERFWGARFRKFSESGRPFRDLDSFFGNPSPVFQEWISHPHRDEYWDKQNPTAEQYASLSIPVLTITGHYDGDQPGALTHYRSHLNHSSAEARANHYLVIGPWDHYGTRAPKAEFCGLKIGSDGVLDIQGLHLQWYAWTMQEGARPAFLKDNVAYYVMAAERWRYAHTLEAVTAKVEVLYLHSSANATDVFHSGTLSANPPETSEPDSYVYDPCDLSSTALEATMDPEDCTDQRMILAGVGRQLIYHSAPFAEDTEISGFFRASLWLAIDQPDTDFRVSVYEIAIDGRSVFLSADALRARYRQDPRRSIPVQTSDPLNYQFEQFTFVSRLVKRGNRLRMVVVPMNSIYSQKNYNTGGNVSDECKESGRTVRVRLFHDATRPSALYVPLGQVDVECAHLKDHG